MAHAHCLPTCMFHSLILHHPGPRGQGTGRSGSRRCCPASLGTRLRSSPSHHPVAANEDCRNRLISSSVLSWKHGPLCLSGYYSLWFAPSCCLASRVNCCCAAFHCPHSPLFASFFFSIKCALFMFLCTVHRSEKQLRDSLDIATVQECVRLVKT